MATDTIEMSNTASNSAAAPAAGRPWFVNRSNALVAALFLAVGSALAVGLGSGDWYVVEFSTFASGSGSFSTNYYGLRIGNRCTGPQTAVSYGSNQAAEGSNGGVQTCTPYTYRSAYLAANYINGNPGGAFSQDQLNAASNAMTAFQHLIGASGIIIALLALGVIIAAHQFFVHAAGAHGVWAPGMVPGRISLVILIIIEALVLIFWITIFPYQYFYNQEGFQFPSSVTSYDTYHTIGLGFSIQIAGLLVGLYGLFNWPKDVVVIKANSV